MIAIHPLLQASTGDHSVARLLFVLAMVFAATKGFGELAIRLKQPPILGEILAGVLLGGSLLGVLDPSDVTIHAMSEIGVVVLLFTAGLHSDVGSLMKVGGSAMAVAVAGVVLPLVGGYLAVTLLGGTSIEGLVAGAAMCATSIGISARVLDDLGRLESVEGRVVLGAAVIDDVIGLIILAVVMALVAGESVGWGGVGRITGIAVAFIVVAIVVGGLVATIGHRVVRRARSSGMLGLAALVFAFVLAALADRVGSAMIVGAFAAGLVLDDRHDRREIERSTRWIGYFFIPIFFASVGAQVDLRAIANGRSLAIGVLLIVVGIAGKIAAGWAPWRFRGNRLMVGVAMIPRGEVGLIFAQAGLATGAIDQGLFGAIMLMVLATTVVTPPLLSGVLRRMAPR